MDANLQGLLEFGKRRSLRGVIKSDNGYELTDNEARTYIRWEISFGYKYLSEVPDFEDIRDKLEL